MPNMKKATASDNIVGMRIDMDIYRMNIDAIVSHLKRGFKRSDDFRIGIEIEHFVFDSNDRSAGYEKILDVMKDIMDEDDKPYYLEGHLIGFYNDRYSISLEPASQLEISIAPCASVDELVCIYRDFRRILDPVLSRYNLRVECYGYNPYESAQELDIIPKKRYEYMDRYFQKAGTRGRNMMRATASVQVSVDYSDENDAIRKYRLAAILSPVLSLMMDNSPVFEKQPAAMHMVRAYVWDGVDADRCVLMDGCLAPDFSFEKYAEYIMNMPAILVMEGETAVYTDDKKIKDIYAERVMTDEEVMHVLSMAFFDVRLKNYSEIRMADSCNIDKAAWYARIICNIFYNDDNMGKAEEYFAGVGQKDVLEARESLIQHGKDGIIYGKKAECVVGFVTELGSNAAVKE